MFSQQFCLEKLYTQKAKLHKYIIFANALVQNFAAICQHGVDLHFFDAMYQNKRHKSNDWKQKLKFTDIQNADFFKPADGIRIKMIS